MTKLRARESTTARALEFTILCAARMGEVLGNSILNEANPAKLGVRFGEIDLKDWIWTVPAMRMKTGKPHRVPLSARVVAIVQEMAACRQGDLLFPGVVPGRPIGGTTVREMLCELRPGVTTHGFRSTFAPGLARRPGFRVRSLKWRLLTRSAMQSNAPTGAMICSISGAL